MWISLFLQNQPFCHELLPLLASLLISLSQMEAHQGCPPLSYTVPERKLVHFGPTQPETPPRPLCSCQPFPGRERRWAQIRGLYLGPKGRQVKFKVKVWHGRRLLALAVSSHLLHLLMWGSGSVPNPHVPGLILDGPYCFSFNEKDERNAGWENTQPSSPHLLLPPHSLCSSSRLFSTASLTGPPAWTHLRLFTGVGEVLL